jgi:outer membrane protein, heavy metal efflux system
MAALESHLSLAAYDCRAYGYSAAVLCRFSARVAACCFLSIVSAAGCSAHRGAYPPSVPHAVQAFADAPSPCTCPGEFILPASVSLNNSVDEDEAVSTALANNAAFRAALMQLGMAEGDVIQAGLLSNPNLQTFFPVGAKQWEWTLYFPLETFVLRRHRVDAAQRDYERIANTLVQTGLNFVRDVRVAHTDLALALAQADLAEETVRLRQNIGDLTQKRLERGDISELEGTTARIDLLNARAAAGVAAQNVPLASARLAALMGLPSSVPEVRADSLSPPPPITLNIEDLIEQAMASRPDMQAAEWAVASASARTRLSRWLFWRVDAAIDANEEGPKGFEIGPGLRIDIPIFNRNQGGITRADAELMQARYNRDAIRDQIVQDVRTAATKLRQAQDNLSILRDEIVPSLREAATLAERAYEAGGTSYLLVLQTSTDYIAARTREIDQTAAARRALAELERSVGRKIVNGPDTWTDELPAPLLPPDEIDPALIPDQTSPP